MGAEMGVATVVEGTIDARDEGILKGTKGAVDVVTTETGADVTGVRRC